MSGGGAFGIFGDMFQARAGERASETQGDAAAAQGNLQNYMYQQSRADLAPYRHIGTQALNALAELYGFSGYEGGTDIKAGAPFSVRKESHRGELLSDGLSHGLTPGTRIDFNPDALGDQSAGGGQGGGRSTSTGTGQPNYDRFLSSPDYTFALEQGLDASNKQAAASGRLRSGGQMKALTRYGQGMASQQLGTYFNRLAAMAGIGQTATNQAGNLGAHYGDRIGDAIGNAGGAAAAGQLYRGNVIGQGFNNMAGNMGYNGNRNNGGDTSVFGGNGYSEDFNNMDTGSASDTSVGFNWG